MSDSVMSPGLPSVRLRKWFNLSPANTRQWTKNAWNVPPHPCKMQIEIQLVSFQCERGKGTVLVSSSVMQLPTIPLWLGTQTILMMIKLDAIYNTDKHSLTSFECPVIELSASIAALLSECILKSLLRLFPYIYSSSVCERTFSRVKKLSEIWLKVMVEIWKKKTVNRW